MVKKFKKDVKYLKHMIKKINQMDTSRVVHPTTEEMVYTCFSSLHRTFAKTAFLLDHRANFNNFKDCHLADNILDL